MRIANVLPVVALLAASVASSPFFPAAAAAQDWVEYENREYGFAINFPNSPAIEDTTYTSASGAALSARVFSAAEGAGRYTMTVVDFSGRDAEEDAAVEQAAAAMRERGEVVYEVVSDLDEVPSPQFMIVEPDGRQMLATIAFYNSRLYIAEGSVAPDAAAPSQYQQSMMLLNPDGTRPNGAGQNAEREARQRAFEEAQRQRELERQQQPQ